MAYKPLRGTQAANISTFSEVMMILGQFHFGMLNKSHFVRRSSTVHSLKMKCAQHCIQKLRHPKL